MGLFDSMLNSSSETMRKIEVVKGLLKRGSPIYKAVKMVGLGWKNYYRYAPLIYDDPDILVPLSKTFLRNYEYRMDLNNMRIVLDGVAKYTAEKLVRRAMYKGKPEWVRGNPGKA